MIDDKQIRAARAILDWSQEKLAEMSGVARATVKNIENRTTLPRLESANAIRETLEKAGVEFLASSGVRIRDRMIETHDGKDANRVLVEDIYETLRATGGELLIAFLNEERAIKDLGAEYLAEQAVKRQQKGITSRLLVHPEERHMVSSLDTYRIIPKEYFSDHPFFIYGPKLALLCTDPLPRVVILKDASFADSARKLFDFIWDRTEMPSSKNKAKLLPGGQMSSS